VELSDREKRLLDEMEAALLTEDPRLVSALSAGPTSRSRNRIMVGIGLVLLGLVTLFGGLVSKVTPIGILGFLIALSGVISAISSFTPRAGNKAAKKPRTRLSLSDRMEKRWDNRGQEN
jgi:uncharacterized membrane protein HdeD (DUF308 family)